MLFIFTSIMTFILGIVYIVCSILAEPIPVTQYNYPSLVGGICIGIIILLWIITYFYYKLKK